MLFVTTLTQEEVAELNNPIKERLTSGKPSIGSWLNMDSPVAAEVMASVGYSWLVVDAEHGPYDLSSIAHSFRAIEARGALPLVRVWDHDPVTTARVLDAGAWGIVYPHVSTAEQAEKLARAMRYPPGGTRSAGTGRCVTLSSDYRTTFNDQVLCIPQIEDLEGIDNAEAIARVEGVDIGFLGPGDLALSMGVAPGHPDHEAALQRLREGCERAGIPSGIPVGDADAARQRIREGFSFIDLTCDLRMLETAAKRALADAQRT